MSRKVGENAVQTPPILDRGRPTPQRTTESFEKTALESRLSLGVAPTPRRTTESFETTALESRLSLGVVPTPRRTTESFETTALESRLSLGVVPAPRHYPTYPTLPYLQGRTLGPGLTLLTLLTLPYPTSGIYPTLPDLTRPRGFTRPYQTPGRTCTRVAGAGNGGEVG
jgi:hypothetical protein